MAKLAASRPLLSDMRSAGEVTLSEWEATRGELQRTTEAMRDTIVLARSRLYAAHHDLLAANACIRAATLNQATCGRPPRPPEVI